MRKFKIDGNEYSVKTCFEECSIDEISHVMVSQNYLVALRGNTAEVLRLKLGILVRLSGLEIEVLDKLTRIQKVSLLNMVRWAFDTKIMKKPFEFFEVEGLKYYLPDDGYANTNAVEMALCNIYYLVFANKHKPNPDLIHNIVATICRPERKDLKKFRLMLEKWTGDRREVFNSVVADERAKFFKDKAPLGVLIAVLQYWEAMNNRFVKRFDDVFNGGGDSKPLFNNGEGWLSMLEDVAETGIMGDLEKVHSTNAVSVMMYILHKQKKIERLEELREKESSE